MREVFHPKAEDLNLSRVLDALSDPVRLNIVRRLAAEGELTCGALGADRPKSSMSHHFRTLQAAGVIHTRVEGTNHLNSLRKADLEKRFKGLLAVVLRSKE
jgi:DNA-binding transcriptional ArsR family regulator